LHGTATSIADRSARALELQALQESLLPEEEVFRCLNNLRAIENELLVVPASPAESTSDAWRFFCGRISELHPINKQSTVVKWVNFPPFRQAWSSLVKT